MSETYVLTSEFLKDLPRVEMPRQPRLTNRQLDFLRNLRKHPNSLPLMTWPRTTTLRKWMRRPRFAAAIKSLEEAFQVEARLVMAGSAAQAATLLQATLTGGSQFQSGQGTTPNELSLYYKPLKQLMGVLWLEMARREQAGRAGLEEQILQRTGDASDDVLSEPDYVI